MLVHRSLLQTGRISFDLTTTPQSVEMDGITYFDDDDDDVDEEGRPIEFDDAGEGGVKSSGTTKNKYEYLKDLSVDVFVKPSDGTIIQDLFSDGSIMKTVSL